MKAGHDDRESTTTRRTRGTFASSLAPSSELWSEALGRLTDIQTTAESSSQLWDEISQRLAEVQASQARLSSAVDRLGVVMSGGLVTEPQHDLTGPGTMAGLIVNTDVPPLLLPSFPDVGTHEVREETPGLSEPTAALATPSVEVHEPEADRGL